MKTARPRILVVDDDMLLSEAITGVLDAYDVTTAHDAHSAIEALRVVPFDLVVCDLQLEDTSGVALYEDACRRFPRLRERFLFMSGGPAPGLDCPLVEKPFDLHELRARVAERL